MSGSDQPSVTYPIFSLLMSLLAFVIALVVGLIVLFSIPANNMVLICPIYATAIGSIGIGLLSLFLKIGQNKARVIAAGFTSLAISNLFAVFLTSIYDPAHDFSYALHLIDDPLLALILMNALIGLCFGLWVYGLRSIMTFILVFTITSIPFGFWVKETNRQYLDILNRPGHGSAFGWDFSGMAMIYNQIGLMIIILLNVAAALGLSVGFFRLLVLKRKDDGDMVATRMGDD